VAEALAKTRPSPIEFVGVQDTFGESGEPGELAEKYGIGAAGIAEAARRAVARKGVTR
jgi:transketolase